MHRREDRDMLDAALLTGSVVRAALPKEIGFRSKGRAWRIRFRHGVLDASCHIDVERGPELPTSSSGDELVCSCGNRRDLQQIYHCFYCGRALCPACVIWQGSRPLYAVCHTCHDSVNWKRKRTYYADGESALRERLQCIKRRYMGENWQHLPSPTEEKNTLEGE